MLGPIGYGLNTRTFSADFISIIMGINFESYGKALENQLSNCHQILINLKKQIDEYNSLNGLLNNWTKSSQHVIVPLTRLVFVPGHIENLNEIILFIGHGYYVKTTNSQAIDIIKLRLSRIELQIIDITNSRDTLNKKLFMKDQIINLLEFDKNIVEIKEDYNMEAEKTWREKHKANLSKYHQNQAKRNKVEPISNNFEELDSMEIEEKIDTLINYPFSTNENILSKQNCMPLENHVNSKRVKWNSNLEQNQHASNVNQLPNLNSNLTRVQCNSNIEIMPNENYQNNKFMPNEMQNNATPMPKSILKVKANSNLEKSDDYLGQHQLFNDIEHPQDDLMISETCHQIQNINILGDIIEKSNNEHYNQPITTKSGRISQFKKDKLAQKKKNK